MPVIATSLLPSHFLFNALPACGDARREKGKIMHPRLKPLAILPALALSATLAQAEAQLDQVVVTATRFAEQAPAVPGNVTIISREDIRTSPARNIPDLLQNSATIP